MKLDKVKLEIAMARAQMSRSTLSKEANVPMTTLNSVCTRCACKPVIVGKLAKALGCDVTEIIEQ